MNKLNFTLLLGFTLLSTYSFSFAQENYWDYHKAVLRAEVCLAKEDFQSAYSIYQNLIDTYPFVFLRDYQVASQLALQVGDTTSAFTYIRKGIAGGWKKKYLKNTTFLKPIFRHPKWENVKVDYKKLRQEFEAKRESPLGEQVRAMSRKDQRKALRALFVINSKAQDRYAERAFAPHSEQQLAELKEIMEKDGYPGENKVGSGVYIATIISHHNSISSAYAQQDTIYPKLRPQLLRAIQTGDLSPYEFAIIEDWYVAVRSERRESSFGFINELTPLSLVYANSLRKKYVLRSVELRNQLIDVEQKTGMYFYLGGEPWVVGKLETH